MRHVELMPGAMLVLLLTSALCGAEEDVAAAEAELTRALVTVVARDKEGKVLDGASGFFLSSTSVVTNRYILLGASSVEITASSGAVCRFVGVVADDPYWDIVMLEVERPAGTVGMLGIDTRLPDENEEVLVIASSMGGKSGFSAGKVSAVLDIGVERIIRVTAAPPEGWTRGGPVVDMSGAVLAVVRSQTNDGGKWHFAVPARRLEALKTREPMSLREWRASFRTGRGAAASDPRCRTAFLGLIFGDLRRTLKLWDRVVRRYPDDGDAWLVTGFSRLRRGRWGQAAEAFKEAVRLNEDCAEAYLGLGIAYGGMIEGAKAVTALETASNLKKDSPQAQLALGMAYGKENKSAQALKAYRKALSLDGNIVTLLIKLDPDDSLTWLVKGLSRGTPHGWQDAAVFFNEVLRQDPKSAEAHVGLAMYLMYLWTHDPDSAFEEARKAIELNPKLVEAHLAMGELFLQWPTPTNGDPVASFNEALRLDPDNARAHYGLGMLYSEQGNDGGLLREYKILLRLDSELADDLYSEYRNFIMIYQ